MARGNWDSQGFGVMARVQMRRKGVGRGEYCMIEGQRATASVDLIIRRGLGPGSSSLEDNEAFSSGSGWDCEGRAGWLTANEAY